MKLFVVTVFHQRRPRQKKHRASRYLVHAESLEQAKSAVTENYRLSRYVVQAESVEQSVTESSCYDIDFLVAQSLDSDGPHVLGIGVFHYDMEKYESIKMRHSTTR